MFDRVLWYGAPMRVKPPEKVQIISKTYNQSHILHTVHMASIWNS